MQERKWNKTQWKLGYRTCLNFTNLNPLKYLKKCVFCAAAGRGMGWAGGTQEQAVLPVCQGGGGEGRRRREEEGISAHPQGSALKRQRPGDSHTASDSVAIQGEPCLEYNNFYIHKGTKLSGFHSHYPDSLKMLLHLVSWTEFPVAGSWCLLQHASDKVQLIGCLCRLTALDMTDQFLQFLLEV